jgi:hypothetical protein
VNEAMTTASDDEGRDPRLDRLWLALILVGALAVRVATQIALPQIHHSDEIFQVIEQSHGIVFGYRMIPFEFDVGMRSWILPGLLAVPMWLASLVTDDPVALTLAVNLGLVLLSLLIVAAAFVAGRRLSLTHAIAAGVVAAIWFELVFHAGRTLTEMIATVPLVLALALAASRRCVGAISWRWVCSLGSASCCGSISCRASRSSACTSSGGPAGAP